ncbi:hypothetical protein FGB62_84g15 [Gracilaria domingensis]|nr:hypothetical protein FGB62_84g15 [Gracilaria domingensis]
MVTIRTRSSPMNPSRRLPFHIDVWDGPRAVSHGQTLSDGVKWVSKDVVPHAVCAVVCDGGADERRNGEHNARLWAAIDVQRADYLSFRELSVGPVKAEKAMEANDRTTEFSSTNPYKGT